MEQKSIGQALRFSHTATRVAKALRVAHGVALGCAAASLVLGGVRAVKRMRGE